MPADATAYDPATGLIYDPETGAILGTRPLNFWDDDNGEAGGGLPVIDMNDPGTVDVTAENLRNAAQQAAAAAGIADMAAARTQEQQVAYIANLKAIILANPGSFSAAVVAVAQNINLDRPEYSTERYNVADLIAYNTQILQGAENAARATVDAYTNTAAAAGQILNALNNVALGLGNVGKFSGLLQIAIPIGLVIWGLSYAAPAIKETRSIFR